MSPVFTFVRIAGLKWHRFKTIFFYSFFFQKIGKHCVLINPFLITPESIVLADNVFIGWRARIEGVKQYQSKKFTPKIILNDGVSIQQNLHLTCAESIEIGKNTAIAANVSITDIHHPYEDISLPIEHQDIKTDPVFIGDDCKIYNNSVILPGTRVGRHCTIGANSVVAGKFEDYCVIVGSPARVIKRYSFEEKAWLRTDAKGNFIEI